MSHPPTQLPVIDLSDDLQAEYVNLVRISHSPMEIVFDYASLLAGQARAKVRSRLVMSPIGAKLFLRALAENLARYEAAFGEIQIPGDSQLAEHLFRPLQPPEPPKA